MNDILDQTEPRLSFDRAIRKGTEDDDTPVVLLATHGHFSNRFFHAMQNALRQAAPVVEHVLSLQASQSPGGTDLVQRTKDLPLPFNTVAFHDVNETYAQLVYWVNYWAAELKRQAPGPAVRAWRSGNGRVNGLPANISPGRARYETSMMTTWLTAHLEDICWQEPSAVVEFHDVVVDVFRVAARWPMKEKPRYSDMPCPDDDCKGRIAVFPPDEAGEMARITCEGCGRVFLEEDYERLVGVFQQISKEQKRSDRVKARLMKKHGAA